MKEATAAIAAAPVPADSTAKPWNRRAIEMTSTMFGSSSTTSTRCAGRSGMKGSEDGLPGSSLGKTWAIAQRLPGFSQPALSGARHPRRMRILVIDDDRAHRDALRRVLSHGGYEVELAENGLQGLTMVATTGPDAVVLDAGMPGLDGLRVCRRLRESGERVPVLMIGPRDAPEDRIDGLDAGADDYIVKPFDVGELKARLRALLRRAAADAPKVELRFAELELDAERHGAVVGRRFAELSRTELQLLELLLRNPRTVLTREVIYQRVWGYEPGPESNALRVYVGYLRRKLEQAGARPLIHTIRGVGYVLREP